MGAALTIVVLFAVSSTIVRVAGVVLEHTGMPMHAARLQALSALSGTGFTTSESEALMRHPVRRQVLMYLMICGSIGIASVAATVIVSALNVSTEVDGLLLQGASVVLALLFVRYVLLSQRVDDLVCGLAFRWLNQHGDFARSYVVSFQLAENRLIAEHRVKSDASVTLADLDIGDLKVLGRRKPGDLAMRDADPAASLVPEDFLVLMGPAEAHEAFARRYGDVARDKGRHGGH